MKCWLDSRCQILNDFLSLLQYGNMQSSSAYRTNDPSDLCSMKIFRIKLGSHLIGHTNHSNFSL